MKSLLIALFALLLSVSSALGEDMLCNAAGDNSTCTMNIRGLSPIRVTVVGGFTGTVVLYYSPCSYPCTDWIVLNAAMADDDTEIICGPVERLKIDTTDITAGTVTAYVSTMLP